MILTTTRRPVIAKRTTGSRLKLNIFKMILIMLCFFNLTACGNSNQAPPNLNMVISVSSDGNYAIATNTNKQAVLWNLKDHSYKIVFKNANVYSAYFIKNTDDFMYQNDKTNEVIVENVQGQTIKTFNPGFPTYGEVMTSDLQNYFASDRWFQLYKINLQTGKKQQFFYYYCGPNYKDETPPPKGMPYACQEFLGSDQLFGLNLTPNDKTLISTASGAMYIWDVATTKQLKLLIKNDAQTFAAISPNGNYVITADGEVMGYMYNFNSQKGYQFVYNMPSYKNVDSYFHFYLHNPNGTVQQLPTNNVVNSTLSVRFVDKDKAILIYSGAPVFPYAGLYDFNDMKSLSNPNNPNLVHQIDPVSYLALNANDGQKQDTATPFLSDDYNRGEAIDTSPSAHILVMSQQNANGIIVYKYDPTTQTLNRDWVGTVKSSWW